MLTYKTKMNGYKELTRREVRTQANPRLNHQEFWCQNNSTFFSPSWSVYFQNSFLNSKLLTWTIYMNPCNINSTKYLGALHNLVSIYSDVTFVYWTTLKRQHWPHQIDQKEEKAEGKMTNISTLSLETISTYTNPLSC